MSTDKTNNIDKIFNEALGGYSKDPPAEIWFSVKDTIYKKNQKRSLLFFFKIAAAIAAIISIGVASLLLFNKQSSNNLVNNTNQITNYGSGISIDAKKSIIKYSNNTSSSRISSKNMKNESSLTSTTNKKEEINNYYNRQSEKSSSKSVIFSLIDSADIEQSTKSRIISELETDTLNVLYISENEANENIVDSVTLENEHVQQNQQLDNTAYNESFAYNYESNSSTKTKKWFIGGQVAPTYAYRSISDNNAGNEMQMEQSEAGLVAYSGGVDVGYKSSKRLQIQTGIYYSKIGSNINVEYNPARNYTYTSSYQTGEDELLIIETSAGIMYNSSKNEEISSAINVSNDILKLDGYAIQSVEATTKGQLSYNYEYLEIPMLLKYKLINKKVGISVLGGMGANFLINESAVFTLNNVETEMTNSAELNTINYSTTIGMGLNYTVSKKLDIVVEPTFKLYLNTISNDNTGVDNYYPYLFGLYTGFNFSF